LTNSCEAVKLVCGGDREEDKKISKHNDREAIEWTSVNTAHILYRRCGRYDYTKRVKNIPNTTAT